MWFSSLPNLSPPPAPKGGLPGARGRDSTVAVGSRSLFRGPPAEEGYALPGAPLTSESPKPYVESVVALLSGSDGLAISKSTDSQAAAITSRLTGNAPRQAGDWRPDFQPMASPWRPSCGVNMVVAARWLGRPVAGVAHFPALVPSTVCVSHAFPARNRLGTAQLRGMPSRCGVRTGLTGPSEPGRAAGRRPARPVGDQRGPAGLGCAKTSGLFANFVNFEFR